MRICLLVLVVENVNLEGARRDVGGVCVRRQGLRGRDPHVELRQPVLKGVHLQDATARAE